MIRKPTLLIFVEGRLRKVILEPTHLYMIKLPYGVDVDVVLLDRREVTSKEIEFTSGKYYRFGLTNGNEIIAEEVA